MATVKLYYDTRGLKQGTLKIKVSSKTKASYINLSIHLDSSQWNEKKGKIVNHPQAAYLNSFVQDKVLSVEQIVRELPSKMDGLQMVSVIKKRLEANGDQYMPENLFVPIFKRYAELREAARTVELYEGTLRSMMAFDSNLDTKSFDDIDEEWLEKYDKWLKPSSPSPNARAIHYRNIRAVFNYAMKKLKMKVAYPFYDFKIKTEATAKRSLTVDQIRELCTGDHYSNMRPNDAIRLRCYIDIFKLSIFLCGIRPIDLANLKRENMVGDRIEYRSKKTGTFYSVKIEPEAKEIIEKYPGENYLLFIKERYKSYRSFFSQSNDALKNIGKERSHLGRGGGHLEGESKFPGLSAYWSRHSWATLAAELDIPIETISKGLGHMIGEEMTLIYVAYRQKKVDDANRKLIDYVMNIEKNSEA